MKSATHPLTRAVLTRIVKDEAPHGRFGFLYLDWAAERMEEAERARLAKVATEMLRLFSPYWSKLKSRVDAEGRTTEGFLLEHIRELGWTEAEVYAANARLAVREEIAAPLARYGIEMPAEELEAMLAQGEL